MSKKKKILKKLINNGFEAYFVGEAVRDSILHNTIKRVDITTSAYISAIKKIFDGIIDIPLAALTDTLKTKWGKRRPPIAVCFIPMTLAYMFCWIPIFGEGSTHQLANTIWIVSWALVFFSTYTMSLISFYGSLSQVCATDNQRLRVSSFKSFFDTITYIIVYALVPLLLGVFNVHIDKYSYL